MKLDFTFQIPTNIIFGDGSLDTIGGHAKDLGFKKRFFEMAGLSLTIAFINFFIGILIRKIFAIDI